jgi:4-hydroxy-4-methyl-2-oxoglutarate aldolase
MKDITDLIIDNIERNRISTCEVSDVLDKSGVVEGVQIVNQGKFAVGKVTYVYGYDFSNWSIHEQIQNIEEGRVVFVDTFNCGNMAAFGDLVTKFLILYKKAKAVVVNGLVRDVHNLRKHSYPVWASGFSPLGCHNKSVSLSEDLKKKILERKNYFEDGIMVCDDSGCTLIQKNQIAEGILKKLDFIELQEDIWSFCINTLKWNTFETVCLENYLKNKEALPESLLEKFNNISKG